MSTSAPPVDLRRPLLEQIGALGASYEAWVHRSIKPRGSLRIFRGDRWERLTHYPWWIVPLVWLPVVGALHLHAVLGAGVPPGRALALAAVGLVAWTLVEYVLHRFVFHLRPRSDLGRRIHFLAHGIHHLDPWDRTRLVFPPLAGLAIATPIFLLLWASLAATSHPLGHATATMAGLLLGYVAYDLTHYAAHHARPRTSVGKRLKAWHLAHHHKHWDRMFGVTSPLWDLVFRTGRPR